MSHVWFKRFRQVPKVEVLEARDVPAFLQPVHHAVIGETRGVAVADFNNDTCLDAAVAARQPAGKAVVLLGDCAGGLGPPAYYPVGFGHALVAADLNRDGAMDLVAGGGGIDVLLGNGDGSFQPAKFYSTGGQGVSDIAIGDLNGDDVPDIATSSNSLHDDSMSTLLGYGDGSFHPFEIYWIGHGGANGVAVGDLDRDGLDDATVDAHWGHELHVFYGNGSHRIFHLTSPWGHSLADLNRDGDLDVVAGSLTREKIYVMSNRGDGVLQPETSFATPNTTMYVVVADISHDGKRDIITRDGIYLLGNGDATFQRYVTYDTGAELARIAAGDLNQDGFTDLVAASSEGVTVILNNKRWRNPAPLAQSFGTDSNDGAPQPAMLMIEEIASLGAPRRETIEAVNTKVQYSPLKFRVRATESVNALDVSVLFVEFERTII
jgi:hypothetical protein